MARMLRGALVGAVSFLTYIEPAYAYLDPGTGSILLQGLIAAVAGGLVAIRVYWAKIRSLLGLKNAISIAFKSVQNA